MTQREGIQKSSPAELQTPTPATIAETRASLLPKPRIEARATLGEKGRLVIPAALREALGLKVGDTLDLHIEDHELRLSKRLNRMARAQERVRKLVAPGRSLADELSAERRAEALRELGE